MQSIGPNFLDPCWLWLKHLVLLVFVYLLLSSLNPLLVSLACLPRCTPATVRGWAQCPAGCGAALGACSPPSSMPRSWPLVLVLMFLHVSGYFYGHQQPPLPAAGFLPGGYGCGGGRGRVTRTGLTSCLSFFFLSPLYPGNLSILFRVASAFLWLNVQLHQQTSKFCFPCLRQVVWNLAFSKI